MGQIFSQLGLWRQYFLGIRSLQSWLAIHALMMVELTLNMWVCIICIFSHVLSAFSIRVILPLPSYMPTAIHIENQIGNIVVSCTSL